MQNRFSTLVTASVAALAVAVALAASPAPAQATSATQSAPTKTIALISAVGDQFSFVRQKESVGSNLDPYIRKTISVPSQVINNAVLRGLDRAMGAEFPDSNRVFLSLAADPGVVDLLPQDREAYVTKRVMALIEAMPQRQQWDEIIVVTPKYLMNERAGMGGKLAGIGLYVQPLEGSKLDSEMGMGLADEETESPDKEKRGSKTYVAPYFYTNVTTLDAKTMKVLKKESRHDFRKLYDPESAAIDVQNAIPTDQLAKMIERFVETAAVRSLSNKAGSVEIGPLKSSPASK
jgi:hypothetical protein